MNTERIIEIINNSDLKDKLDSMDNFEDLQKFFAEKGEKVELDQLKEVVRQIALTGTDEEMDEGCLDAVSGGGAAGDVWNGIKWGWNAGKKFYQWEKSIYKKYGLKY